MHQTLESPGCVAQVLEGLLGKCEACAANNNKKH
jgi:hypothetical protein